MQFFTVIETATGKTYNHLANDTAGAKRLMAAKAAEGLAGRRGRVIEGDAYSVDGEVFGVELYMDTVQGSQPSRSTRVSRQRWIGGEENYGGDWQRNGRGEWVR